MEETDRVFRCEYCRVGSYLTVPDFFRYILPPKAPAGKELIYFPYWRYKGMLFSCLAKKVQNRFVDISHQALRSSHFPINIGFRGQTQKIRFATADIRGTFIKPQIPFSQLLDMWSDQYSAGLPKPILHQDWIGETRSLVYAPFYLDKQVMDGILNEPVSQAVVDEIPQSLLEPDEPKWPITFLAILCPQCGWDLNGERDSLALNCTNCQTVWQAKKGKLEQLNTAHVPEKGDDWVYMPFWRIKADVSDITLDSYADLIQVANLPKVAQPGWEQIAFSFWSPAFKVRPQNFLTLATNVTLNQPVQRLLSGQPKGRLQAVNLPLQEAVESLKLNLAGFMRPRKKMADLIETIRIRARRFLLIYLPFKDTPHELVHPDLNLSINKNLLVHSKNL